MTLAKTRIWPLLAYVGRIRSTAALCSSDPRSRGVPLWARGASRGVPLWAKPGFLITNRKVSGPQPWTLFDLFSGTRVGINARPPLPRPRIDTNMETGPRPTPRRVVHGAARPFHQKSTCLTQSTLGPYVVQIWSRTTPSLGRTNPAYSTEWDAHLV